MGVALLGGKPCLGGSQYRGDDKREGSCVCSQGCLLGSVGNMRMRVVLGLEKDGAPCWGPCWSRSRGVGNHRPGALVLVEGSVLEVKSVVMVP